MTSASTTLSTTEKTTANDNTQPIAVVEHSHELGLAGIESFSLTEKDVANTLLQKDITALKKVTTESLLAKINNAVPRNQDTLTYEFDKQRINPFSNYALSLKEALKKPHLSLTHTLALFRTTLEVL